MFGKFFASTFTGSMVGSGVAVFAVWGYVIANTRKSQVELNPRLLAAILGSTESEIAKAIEILCSPDPNSRSKIHDGRRLIREGQFAYQVPNYELYRGMRDEDTRREYNRTKKRESRQRIGQNVRQTCQPSSAQAEAEAEADSIDPLDAGSHIPLRSNPPSANGKGPLKPEGQNLKPAERATWDLRRFQEARKTLNPQAGSQEYYLQGEEKLDYEAKLDKEAAFIAGLTLDRLIELISPFHEPAYIDRLKVKQPLFG